MKALVIFGLWAFLGWDVGAWAESLVGIPAVVGVIAGLAIGAWLAVEARRRVVAANVTQAATPASIEPAPLNLDRAA